MFKQGGLLSHFQGALDLGGVPSSRACFVPACSGGARSRGDPGGPHSATAPLVGGRSPAGSPGPGALLGPRVPVRGERPRRFGVGVLGWGGAETSNGVGKGKSKVGSGCRPASFGCRGGCTQPAPGCGAAPARSRVGWGGAEHGAQVSLIFGGAARKGPRRGAALLWGRRSRDTTGAPQGSGQGDGDPPAAAPRRGGLRGTRGDTRRSRTRSSLQGSGVGATRGKGALGAPLSPHGGHGHAWRRPRDPSRISPPAGSPSRHTHRGSTPHHAARSW